MKKALLTVLLMGAAFAQTKPSLTNPASLNATAPATYDVKMTTSKGDVTIHVTRAWAPLGADRFYNLVKNGYFTDVVFFRVLANFMAQFGVSPDPNIARAWQNANIKDDKVSQSNTRGRITFATAGPNTRTTQLFINYRDNSGLDGQGFAPFGEVTSGMEAIDKLYSDYGEGAPSGHGPSQDRLQSEGKAYTDRFFPKLDKIISAKIVAPAGASAK
jgi:peptidyl-prolyl cis-trans isomerase A (cyclophilin A)